MSENKVTPTNDVEVGGQKPFLSSKLKNYIIIGLGVLSLGLLVGMIVLALGGSSCDADAASSGNSTGGHDDHDDHDHTSTGITFSTTKLATGTGKLFSTTNQCAGKKADFPNKSCLAEDIGAQSGANVTEGYQGDLNISVIPILQPYSLSGLCPVNVHWHLGAEHYSMGEYDEYGTGPDTEATTRRAATTSTGDEDDEDAEDDHGVRGGYRCNFYDDTDTKFTKEYDWKHCIGMKVGETYEVHWPHSKAGACGHVDQFQTPFYDGVFCMDGVLDLGILESQVGVQSQVFTIVNDEDYYYPNLMRGMIVDGEFGDSMAYYTGSTTGTTRDNEICSQYTPITWQVDRVCHMISASSFDKMCADMLQQRDDMSDDLHAHGSRELVSDDYVANNFHH